MDKKLKSLYIKRLATEIKLIKQKKFARYFNIVHELVSWCRKNDILVGEGRGSAGGALTSFLLGITGANLDPIRHNLLFSRFIAKDREGFPDIDIDFEDSKRHIVKQHLEAIYGYDHVANVSSFNRMKARAVIKDVSRVFNISLKEVNEFTKLIEDNDDHTGIQETIDSYEEGRQFNKKYPKIIKIAKVIEGQVRGYGSHAAALIVSRDPLTQSNRCNLIRRKVAGENTTLINWEKNNAEYVGLMKLDALGLKLLSIFAEAIRLIKENYDKDINLDEINIEDKAVLKEINAGHTAGLFQLNTYAMTSLIKEMGINRFQDLSDAVALVRPGPSNSGMTAQYVERKHGAKWHHLHRAYEKITKYTYGVIVYQEQVMEVINKLAGLPYTTADKIRKIIGKKRSKKEFAPYKKKFIQGCLKQKTLSVEEAKEFWAGLQEHARYSFNKAHSTAYAILGVQSAWLKKYYPTEFICGSLTYGSKTKKPVLIEEAYRLGLTLVLPKVGTSDAERWIARGNKLYIPFKEVKDIGAVKAKQAAVMTTIEYNKSLKDLFYIKNENVQVKHKGSLGKLLEKIGAYELNDDVQLSEEIQSHFDFRIITNPQDTYKNLYGFFEGMIRLDRIDNILNGDLQEINGLNRKKKIINRVKFHGHKNLSSCTSCSLREECSAPVHPSQGKYNITIIGEAPGKDEDEEGEGFVGSSGSLIWKPIRKKGYKRGDFHITNIIKCYPKQSRVPTDKQANICAKFIRKELYEIQPKIILAFGNTCLNFFTRKKSGITNMSGKITWSEEYSSWIVWCIHPAATLHNPENKPIFKKGMASFFKLLKTLNFKR